jgi:hypothetical protein
MAAVARARSSAGSAAASLGCGVRLKFLTLAAKPGPVPRAARPLVPSLLAVLVLANSAAAARLVVVVLRTLPEGQAPPLSPSFWWVPAYLAWPPRPAPALAIYLIVSQFQWRPPRGRTRSRLGIGEQRAVRHLDDQRARNRQAVRSRISLTSSIDVSGCRNTKRPTVSPSHLVGGTNAISSSCNACAHFL